MVRREPSLDRAGLERALAAVLDLAMPTRADVQYRLVGTAAALLHGVDLPAGDVDILVRDRQGVDAFCAALASLPCLAAAVWLPQANQYYASFDVGGVGVEFSTVEVASEADTVETFGRGPWAHYSLLPCGSYRVPAVALELRLLTELRRGRPDRYEPLIAHLRQRGCDAELLRRGLADAGQPQARQEDLLAELAGRART